VCWGKQTVKKLIVIKSCEFVVKRNATATDQVDGERCC
jgi:hypothetical protein